MVETLQAITITYFLHIVLSLCNYVHGDRCTQLLNESSVNGDFKIAGFFNIDHLDQHNISIYDVLWAEMKFAINETNRRLGRNIFGYQLYYTYDTSYDNLTAAVLDILTGEEHESNTCHCHNDNSTLDKLIGIVGPSQSSDSIYVHDLISYHHIPLISYASTSPELSDSRRYPNFFRTCPTDALQAKFITKILNNFNWTYVSIIAVDDSYGRSVIHAFSEEFRKFNICLRVEEKIHFPLDESEVVPILDRLKSSELANVIIVWAAFKEVKSLLELAENVTNKTWIISEASGMEPWFYSTKNKISGNILVVSIKGRKNERFEKYLNSTDSWISKTRLEHFTTDNFAERIQNKTKETLRYSSWLGFVSDAVTAFVSAFTEYVKDEYGCHLNDTNCNPLVIHNHQSFIDKYLKRAALIRDENDSIPFDLNGNLAEARFQLYLASKQKRKFHLISDSSSTYSCISNFSDSCNLLKQTKSRCSELCKKGYSSKQNEGTKCCWSCEKCSENFYQPEEGQTHCRKCPSDCMVNIDRTKCNPKKLVTLNDFRSVYGVYTLSFVGIFITLMFITTFIKHRNSPVARSSNFYLSIVQFVCHLLIFLLPVSSSQVETIPTCVVRVYGIWILFTLIAAITLAKATHILNVFQLRTTLEGCRKVQMKLTTYIIIILSVLWELHLVLVLSKDQLKIEEQIVDRPKAEVYRSCHRTTDYVYQFLYTLLLQGICSIQCFRGRKLPTNYNDGKYIAFATFLHTVFIAASIAVIKSNQDRRLKHVQMLYTTLTTNLMYMLILYGKKIRICLLTPKMNTPDYFAKIRRDYIVNHMRRVTGTDLSETKEITSFLCSSI